MKKPYIAIATVLMIGAGLLSTSCIGRFALTNKLLSWNQQISNKFVNELVFIAFWAIPVYEVSALADILVINSIEFWSGSNPVAKGKTIIEGQDGKYLVECDGRGYTITSLTDKTSVRLDFAADTQTWSVATPEGEVYPLMTFVDADHVRMSTPQGASVLVPLSQSGVMAYQQTVAPAMACR